MKTQRVKFSKACDHRGASMGRPTIVPVNPEEKCRVFRVELSQGYDNGGAYWGFGTPLYCLWSNETQAFVRAEDRQTAKAYFRKNFPQCKFVN